MAKVKRKCDVCKSEYQADSRNLARGWGLCCSKSCAASKREKSKPNYSPIRVKKNNLRRITWNYEPIGNRNYSERDIDESHPLEWDHGDYK